VNKGGGVMIKTVKDLLEELIRNERVKIDTFGVKIKHTVTIGKQYEGATIKSLNASLPEELNLHVTSGFIKDSVGKLSDQIDCMIAINEGELIPGTTDEYLYTFDQVLAIIEVKKNLFTKDLTDAFFHLKGIKDLKDDWRNLSKRESSMLLDIFAKCTGHCISNVEEVLALGDKSLEYIFHGLVSQYQHPLRIIIGYDGFKSEKSLRQKYFEFLSENKLVNGFGPFSYPDLIICGDSCLLKMNGEPYNPTIIENKYEFFASCYDHNIMILTEMIFGRLNRYYPIDFTGDDNVEPLKLFIGASINETGALIGWDVNVHSYYSPEEMEIDWRPTEVSKEAFEVINALFEKPIDIMSDEIQQLLLVNKELISELMETKYVGIKGSILLLLTEKMKIVKVNENKYLIGEDNYGYFSKWLSSNGYKEYSA